MRARQGRGERKKGKKMNSTLTKPAIKGYYSEQLESLLKIARLAVQQGDYETAAAIWVQYRRLESELYS